MSAHDKPKTRPGVPIQVFLTREERRKLNRLAGERTITSVVRELIRNATPSDGLTRGETGANVPTTTRGE